MKFALFLVGLLLTSQAFAFAPVYCGETNKNGAAGYMASQQDGSINVLFPQLCSDGIALPLMEREAEIYCQKNYNRKLITFETKGWTEEEYTTGNLTSTWIVSIKCK